MKSSLVIKLTEAAIVLLERFTSVSKLIWRVHRSRKNDSFEMYIWH